MTVVELQAVFAVFDKDNDGFISMDEVTAVLASMGVRASPEYISDIFNQVDLDGNIMSCGFAFFQRINILSQEEHKFYIQLSFCHILPCRRRYPKLFQICT